MKRDSERVIFVNRFYWPEEPATAQLLTDLASGLAARGIDVTVVTSRPIHSQLPLRETHRDVKIIRVPSSRWGRSNLGRRALDSLSFLWGARRELSARARPGDIFVALTDPPMLGVLVACIAYLYEARCYHWVQDIFPEIAMVVSKNPLLRVLAFCLIPVRNLAWRKSTGAITLGHDMASVLLKAGVPQEKIALISNWAPSGLQALPTHAALELRKLWELEGKFVVAYSGNLGRVHDLEPIVEIAAALGDEPDFVFVFIGQGAGRPALEAAVRQRGLRHVHFYSAQARARLGETLALGDVHLVALRESCKDYVFPSKIYGIAAVGRPILFVGPPYSDPGRLILADGYGFALARNETTKMVAVLRELQKNPAQRENLGEIAAQASVRYGGARAAVLAWEKTLGLKPLAALGLS